MYAELSLEGVGVSMREVHLGSTFVCGSGRGGPGHCRAHPPGYKQTDSAGIRWEVRHTDTSGVNVVNTEQAR